MQKYEMVVKQLRDFLQENHYGDRIKAIYELCFTGLKNYLDELNLDYSPPVAEAWLQKDFETIPLTYRKFFTMALTRMQEIFEHGSVLTGRNPTWLESYTALSDEFKAALDGFANTIKNGLAYLTFCSYRYICCGFLSFLQKIGILTIEDITFEALDDFFQSVIDSNEKGATNILGRITAMMSYCYDLGRVPYGFTVLFHYLSFNKRSIWNGLSETTQQKISLLSDSPDTVDSKTIRSYQIAFIQQHKDNGYHKAYITGINKSFDLLILFLEVNGYKYTPEIAEIWFAEISSQFCTTERTTTQRVLHLIADYYYSRKFNVEKLYRSKPNQIELLPEWCAEIVHQYVALKRSEGWAKSTIDMICSSVCRFCNYLDKIGVTSFHDLNVSHIKSFNINDIHKTPHGKNAYNGRIRKFLVYLGERGYLENPLLFISLACKTAPQETIVVILTEDEMAELKAKLDDDAFSLRKKAMLLLGLKMGMRASDIVDLKIEEIDWDTASIRFIQQKTAVEVNLPMPTEVGNALFKYIMEERPDKKDSMIFLDERAPYKSVSRNACSRALQAALPDRNVEGSGFHVTRRTYATDLLNASVGAGMVAEALGHRDTNSISRYLSLDSDRMRLCPLSLSDVEIGGWKNVQ